MAAVDILSSLGLSVDYSKIIMIETDMAKSVLKTITDNDGVYIPPELQEKEFVHFAADNLDFHEDTPDGRRTLHATVLVGYQKNTEQKIKTIAILDQDNLRAITIPPSIYSLDQCYIRKNAKPDIPKNIALPITSNETLTEALEKTHCWLLATRDYISPETAEDKNKHGLTWSAYNSVVCPGDTEKTTIALFPILDITPMDMSVQLTFLNIFEKVKHQQDRYDELAKLLADSCKNIKTSNLASIGNYAHELHYRLLKDTNFCSKMEEFNQKEGETIPTFAFAIQYMNMVTTMLTFITSVRSRNWNLRNVDLKDFLKYFFVLNRRNYAPLISYHLSELSYIESDDPVTWSHLSSSLWAPNKNGIGFCSLGADEALE
ncbi:unnamed protein product [Ceutorhynchus assimilis]|uniref:Uncharacterized protein n=1 Tax=Ceutorhynchus assimilis TaxID=467358 RepID=A0A9N9MR83_9CUCU|nr:unnamed protein product [Ceutorhynchus assimilis]